MTGEIYAAAAGEFFGALKTVFSKMASPELRKKYDIEKETDKLLELDSEFRKVAVGFNANSRSDELLGLADEVNKQEKKIKSMWVLYATEINGGKK